MGKFQKIMMFWFVIICLYPDPIWAQTVYTTQVKVIHAATGSSHIDPGIKMLVREIESVFKYTDYRLIKTQQMKLGKHQTGTINLPGNRTLSVTPVDMADNRITYQIRIEKNTAPVFQTRILLKNHNSITIGGPQYKQGVLLINVKGDVP
jgi:hypothetical protein